MFLVKCIDISGKEKILKKERVYSVIVVIERDNSTLYGLKEIPGLMFDTKHFIMLTPPGDALLPTNDNLELVKKAA